MFGRQTFTDGASASTRGSSISDSSATPTKPVAKDQFMRALATQCQAARGQPFVLAVVEPWGRPIDGNIAPGPLPAPFRQTFAERLAMRLPGCVVGLLDEPHLALIVPELQFASQLDTLLCAVEGACRHSILHERACWLAMARLGVAFHPEHGQAPLRLVHHALKQAPTQPWQTMPAFG